MNFFPALVTEEHPLVINEELSAEILGLNADSARAEKPIGAELVVQKDEENFLVTGWATTSLSLLCGRCAEWLPWPISSSVTGWSTPFEAPRIGIAIYRLDSLDPGGYFARIAAQCGLSAGRGWPLPGHGRALPTASGKLREIGRRGSLGGAE